MKAEFLHSRRFLACAVIAAAMLSYAGTLSNEFVYDDRYQVLRNKWVLGFRHLPDVFTSSAWAFSKDITSSNYYRPVMHLVYMVDYKVFGFNPWGWHLVNAALHSINALVVFLVAGSLLKNIRPALDPRGMALAAFLAALVFAVHPINSEAVSWVAGVPELTFTLFLLLSFHLFTNDARKGFFSRRRILSLVLFFFALLSKETALVLPIFLLAHDVVVKKAGLKETAPRLLPHLALTTVYLLLRVNALEGMAPRPPVHPDLSQLQYFINILPLLAKYFVKLAVPVGLNAFHELSPVRTVLEIRFILSALLVAGVAFSAWRFWSREPLIAFLCLWVAAPLLPVLYIPVVGENTFAERYLYLPSAGFGIMLSVLMLRAGPSWTRLMPVAALAIALVFMPLTMARTRVWKDDMTLWTDTLAKTPESYFVHYSMGFAYYEKGMLDRALEEYKKALALRYTNPFCHYDTGLAYQDKGMLDEAIFHYKEAIRYGLDRDADVRVNLANAYAGKGMYEDAMASYMEALRRDPENQLARRNMDVVKRRLDGMRDARE